MLRLFLSQTEQNSEEHDWIHNEENFSIFWTVVTSKKKKICNNLIWSAILKREASTWLWLLKVCSFQTAMFLRRIGGRWQRVNVLLFS